MPWPGGLVATARTCSATSVPAVPAKVRRAFWPGTRERHTERSAAREDSRDVMREPQPLRARCATRRLHDDGVGTGDRQILEIGGALVCRRCAQLTDASSEASGLYTETLVVVADAGLSATPVMPSPRFSPATPANVRRAPSPGFAIATSAAAPSTGIATPLEKRDLERGLRRSRAGATSTTVCVPVDGERRQQRRRAETRGAWSAERRSARQRDRDIETVAAGIVTSPDTINAFCSPATPRSAPAWTAPRSARRRASSRPRERR